MRSALSGGITRFVPQRPERAGPGPSPSLMLDGGRFALPRGWSRIGSSARAEIRLIDPSVSRIHARVIRGRDESLHVIDARSLGGVFVNGEPVRWAALHDGDELRIGCFELGVELAAHESVALV